MKDMACVNAKGQLTQSAKKLLRAVGDDSLSPQDISKKAGIPLFKVRSSLRELKDAEYVSEENGSWQLTEKAKKVLEEDN